MRINNINRSFLNIISGVPQRSIFGPVFGHFIKTDNNYNFADNILTAFGISMQKVTHPLKAESSVAIKWFRDNKMIVDPGKFQKIILDKKKHNHTQEIRKNNN